MKATPQRLFIFTLVLLLGLQSTLAQELTQTLTTLSGFSIKLPADWVRIERQLLDNSSHALGQRLPNAHLQSPTDGFQLKTVHEKIDFPYILVTLNSSFGKVTEQDLRKAAADTKEKLQQKANALFENNSYKASPDVLEVAYDEAGGFMRVESKVSVPNSGAIHSTDITFPTEAGMLTFKFATTEAENSKYANLFSMVIKGIEFPGKLGQTANTGSVEEKAAGHDWWDFMAEKVTEAQDELDKAGQFQVGSDNDGKQKVLKSIALRRGQPKFRAELLAAYDGCCAVTGTSIEDVLEAAHIIPFDGESTNHVKNGLLLRADIHALFDLGLLAVDPSNMQIYCSEQIRGEDLYRDLHGKKLRTPSNVKRWPDCQALKEHYDKRK